MDPNSLDWIWEDFVTSDPADPTDEELVAGDGAADDDDGNNLGFGEVGGQSDSSSDSDVGCALMIGDEQTARKLNDIVDDIKKRYGKRDQLVAEDEAEVKSSNADAVIDPEEHFGNESVADAFYIDALEVAKNQLFEVQLVWTDALYECTVNGKNVPDSYMKTTSIEKLVLLYAHNFIEQFKVKYSNRKQLVLVHENECGVQKCICTTIKPSRLVYHDLHDLTSYCEFVAKYVTYTKLEDPMVVPKQFMSPTTTLEMQTANCLELAILLVSFLIGCGYNAFVVYGYATERVCSNDLINVVLEYPKESFNDKDKHEKLEDDDDTYAVEPMIDLCSDYVKYLMEEEKNKTVTENKIKENDPSTLHINSDPLHGKRIHCWVMIMETDGRSTTAVSEPSYYFIEPSTGERKEIFDENYIGIESMWNHKNFWVNLQSLDGGCSQYEFVLTNTERWEHFLLDEPRSLLDKESGSEDEISRSLVMPNSWVNVLEVPRNRYLMMYPSGKKIVPYMNAIKEWYTDYVMPDGLVERTTFYAEPEYARKRFVREIYKHRTDKLLCVEMKCTVAADKVECVEYFSSGRKDCLKVHKYNGDSNSILTDRLITFYNLRLDAMAELKIDENSFVIKFNDRSDLLFWRSCTFKKGEDNDLNVSRKPLNILEKYLRDESKDKDRDIASRLFNYASNRIYVHYQYGKGQITQSSRMFEMTSVTSGEKFGPDSVIEDIVYPYESHLKPHEAYVMLQDMMKAESEAVYDISKLEGDVLQMLKTRSQERSEFKLKIDLLDWDRNHKIRKLIQNEKDKKLALAKRDKAMQLEYALPYYETNKRPFTYDTALKVRDRIIADLRRNTKNQFVQATKLFKKNHFKLQSMMRALKIDNFNNLEAKNKTLVLCSLWKTKLDVLVLKMERYKETRFKRYNDLASYLNCNPDFKMLPPLKLLDLNV